MIYINNKNKQEYTLLSDNVIDVTENHPNKSRVMVAYKGKSGQVYVRDKKQFFEKFTKKETK